MPTTSAPAQGLDRTRSCVFCGRRPVTAEHVWPAWLQRLLPEPLVLGHVRTLELEGVEQPSHGWEAPLFGQRVRAVCGGCNHGWMSDLEQQAQPVLRPTLEGHGQALDCDGQRVLATWAYKTCLMLNLLFRDHKTGVPASHYAYLCKHGEPPPEASLWLTAFNSVRPATFATAGMAISRPGELVTGADTPNVYSVTFTVGPLAFHVLGVHDPEAIGVDPRQGRFADSRVHRLWPYEASFALGSAEALTEPELDALAFGPYEVLKDRFGAP